MEDFVRHGRLESLHRQVCSGFYPGPLADRGCHRLSRSTLALKRLNQSQGGMCIFQRSAAGLGVSQQLFSPRLQDGPAATLDLLLSADQRGEEASDPLLHPRIGPQAQISGGFLPHPAPDRLIGVEVRAVARQVDQPQFQTRRSLVPSHRLAAVRRSVVVKRRDL